MAERGNPSLYFKPKTLFLSVIYKSNYNRLNQKQFRVVSILSSPLKNPNTYGYLDRLCGPQQSNDATYR